MPNPITFDGEQYREMTTTEYTQYKADQEAAKTKAAADADAATQAQADLREATRKLKLVGLTDSEIKVLRHRG